MDSQGKLFDDEDEENLYLYLCVWVYIYIYIYILELWTETNFFLVLHTIIWSSHNSKAF